MLRDESLCSNIFVELDNGKKEVRGKGEVYKIKRDLLVVHQEGQGSNVDYWRVIIPDDVSTRNFVVTELHNIPYSLHPGVQRTLYKVRRHFFWKGMTGHIREFVESCPVCQVAKSDHTLHRGKLQSTNIPEKKWTRSILGLYYRSTSNEGYEGLHSYSDRQSYSHGTYDTM